MRFRGAVLVESRRAVVTRIEGRFREGVSSTRKHWDGVDRSCYDILRQVVVFRDEVGRIRVLF